MSHEPPAPATLAASRRKWNTFALVSLALLSMTPLTLAVFTASAYRSPVPLRIGPGILLGPHCKNTSLIIRRPAPPGSGGTVVHDFYSAGGTRGPVWSMRGL